ncbi:MAG: cytochrome d ubiquinol oxidase subunit II [Syntrophotaleaceae bacterium]
MVTLSDLAAGALLLGLIMYAAFGGADFGGGIWTALASGPRKKEQRESLFQAIGPVWETNHVWLIYVVVVLFMVFPRAFSTLFTALLVPLVIALVGINFRGAAFAFRHFGRETGRGVPFIARSFEVSSMLTPLALGMAVAATAGGELRLTAQGAATGPWDWITPFTIVGGLIGLAICAYLAPIYMTVRTQGDLREDFRRRGMIAALVLGMLTTLEIPVAFFDAPGFAARLLLPRTLVCISLAVLFGAATEFLLWRRKFFAAQFGAGATVAFTLLGFGVALYPDLLLGQLTISEAAAPRETLIAFFTVLPFGVIILAPSLAFLYWTFRGSPDPESPPDEFRVRR